MAQRPLANAAVAALARPGSHHESGLLRGPVARPVAGNRNRLELEFADGSGRRISAARRAIAATGGIGGWRGPLSGLARWNMAGGLSVLIAAAGKPALLARTLRSLASTAKPACYRGVIVVENGPRCGIEAVVRDFARQHRAYHLYIAEGNKSHALNCSLARLSDGLVFMTDDDVRFDPHVLTAYAAASADKTSGEFYGGPVLIDAEHGLPPEWLRRFYPLTIADPWRLPYDERTATPGQNFMGTNWAAFVSDLHAVGGFDTRLGPGAATNAAGQETEAQRRLVARSVRPIYLPDAIAWHYLHREFLEPEWILRRTYRHALEWGLRRSRNKKSFAGPILRVAIGRINANLKAAFLRLLGGEERRFAAAFHATKWRGRWDGIWLGRQWDKLPQLVPPPASRDLPRAA
jgi:glycosyltransferase involved in cell wall biosynthesis